MDPDMTIADLLGVLLLRWEEELTTLRKYGALEAIKTKEADLQDLREWWRESQLEELTLEEAASYSGLTYDTLRKKVARGEISNVGEKGRPRVRRGDLPVRQSGPPSPKADDLDSIAARILAARGS